MFVGREKELALLRIWKANGADRRKKWGVSGVRCCCTAEEMESLPLRKSLALKGACRVGKTWALKELGASYLP